MNRWGRAFTFAMAAYVVGAVIGYFLVMISSGNQHDVGIEATMTAAFVVGPLGAVIGFVLGLLSPRGPKKP